MIYPFLSESEKKETQEEIGRTGEEIVAELLGIVLSTYKYDSEKDGLQDGKPVEIKTTTRNRIMDEYHFGANQLEKMRGVEYLYIVDIPLYSDPQIIRVYRCTKNAKLITNKRFLDGTWKEVVAIPRTRLELVGVVKDDPRIKRLIDLATKLSPYRQARVSYEG